MSEWHRNWQSKFPIENVEVVINKNGVKHIADVCINNIVFEFQHSPISLNDFQERNDFYCSAGYKVIWLFDMIDIFKYYVNFDPIYENKYHFSRTKTPFKYMENIRDEKATVYFQTGNVDDDETYVIERVTGLYKDSKIIYTDLQNSLTIKEFSSTAINNSQKLYYSPKSKIDTEQIESVVGGKSIDELWCPNYYKMIVINLVNKKEMIISGENGHMDCECFNRNGNIMGKYTWKDSNGKFCYSEKYYIVCDSDKPIWKLKKGLIKIDNIPNALPGGYDECVKLFL